ncbi:MULTISPECIES: exodeoxyribonuclease VII small subunit [Allobacillus]|uniref:Exodeoxyribonuclease 7 small subunit n=1 Tax=Allobacillus salarius TaxID=1955272 RepID=A0A556PTE6_9BACI|nr:exodeoxyribonuclease VII small subunit [Allobacillus salarius]TSJ67658.1 exodeoxyribonuclease VII small subunit [Allobacillus salarius]
MTEESKTANEELNFEQAMEQLEEIVRALEEGDVPLEKAIELYKKGMELSKICNHKLTSVEKEMTQIMKENGATEDFTMEEEPGDN